jgi:glycosyltransferase involved in cell wall biosynthesis
MPSVLRSSPPLKTKVAYIISTLDVGGAEQQLVNLLNALPEHIEPVVFVLRDQLSLKGRLTNPRVRLEIIGLRKRWDAPRWLRLARALRRERPSVIHSHMLLSNFAARAMSQLCTPNVVVNHEHGLSGWKGSILNSLDYLSQPLADVVVVVSEASRQVRLSRARLDPQRLVVLPNAIDWHALSEVPPASSDFPGATWGVAARLSPIKRVELAIELLARARRLGFENRLLIAGDGPERSKLEERAAALGVSGSVVFLGFVPDMVGFYERIDALLLTSSSEDCPMTVLEALAAGRFVAATAVGGVPELLREASHAHLISDASGLDEAARILGSLKAGFLSLENREYAKKFDLGRYIERLLTLYGVTAALP